jgi:predicted Zn-dependent peptidase
MSFQSYPRLAERVFRRVLSNGLTVIVVPRPGFQRKLAYFATDFGSIHRDFIWEGEHWQVPAGIAHFLEHKMFDLPGRDVSAELAALGAHVNAFTSYDMTAYYFSCTENFVSCLELLLEFVSTPYFTEESVKKELGIIDQEIGMNADAPDTIVFEMLTEGMYRNHDIRTPILGTCDSIRLITPDLLELCHKAFYTPANMVLCVVGDVDPDQIIAVAEKRLGFEFHPVGKPVPSQVEEMNCPVKYRQTTMEISMPSFQLGFKCEPIGKGEQCVRQEILGDLAAEALFGEASKLYLELYEQGIIDTSFGGGFETVDGCALLTCGGDSMDPETVRAAIFDHARRLVAEGIPKDEFLRMKRSALGRRIRDLDSFDSTCFRMCAYHFDEFDYFRFPQIYEEVTVQDVLAFLPRVIQEDRCVLSVIYPAKEEV